MLRDVARWAWARCRAGWRSFVRVWLDGSAALAEAAGGDGRTQRGSIVAIGLAAIVASAWKGVAMDRAWSSPAQVVPPLVTVVVVTSIVRRTAPRGWRAHLRASGLLPMAPVAMDGGRLGRLLLGLVAAGLAVRSAMPVGTEGRVALVAGAITTLTGLACWEARRRRMTPRSDSAVLWAAWPPVVASASVALTLLAQSDRSELTASTLGRLLLATVLAEELLFRGAILPAAYRSSARPLAAELFTAVLFGCWHVGNSLGDTANASLWWRAGHVVGTVALTTCGGLLFSWMRHRSRSLLGPVLTHTATNLPGIAL